MKKILVTGGAGFIGHHFIAYLLKHTDWHITSLDRLDFSGNLNRLNNIIDNGGWHFCNLKTAEELLYKYKNLCETNDPFHFKEKIEEKYLNIEEISKRVAIGQDIIGRNETYEF